MIPGRTKAAFKAWLTQRPQAWREAVEVVAMDGFTGSPDPYSRQADSDPDYSLHS